MRQSQQKGKHQIRSNHCCCNNNSGNCKKLKPDIHIEPQEEGLRVRYRIDGILKEVYLPKVERMQSSVA